MSIQDRSLSKSVETDQTDQTDQTVYKAQTKTVTRRDLFAIIFRFVGPCRSSITLCTGPQTTSD